MLSLPEELMLIALKDEKGTVLFTAASVLPYSLVGAVILDLYFDGKFEFRDNKLFVKDNSKTGRSLCDAVLKMIADEKHNKDLKSWVLKLEGSVKNIKEKALDHLVESKVLRKETTKLLGFISRTSYPTADPMPENELRQKIRKFILEKEFPNERYIALLSLAQVTSLFEDIFHQDELKDAKERLRELVERSHEGDAIREELSRLIKGLNVAIPEASGTSGTI
jgi:hypothetical protein